MAKHRFAAIGVPICHFCEKIHCFSVVLTYFLTVVYSMVASWDLVEACR